MACQDCLTHLADQLEPHDHDQTKHGRRSEQTGALRARMLDTLPWWVWPERRRPVCANERNLDWLESCLLPCARLETWTARRCLCKAGPLAAEPLPALQCAGSKQDMQGRAALRTEPRRVLGRVQDFNRRLREEQDAAFRESLAADREREAAREAQRAAAAAADAAAAEAAAAARCCS
jgi:hypothetical protein